VRDRGADAVGKSGRQYRRQR